MKQLPKFRTELHDLLVNSLPADFAEGDRLDTKKLAETLGYARYHIYRHLTENRLSPKLAMKLIDLSSKVETKRGALTAENLTKYVLTL